MNLGQDVCKDYNIVKFRFVHSDFTVTRKFVDLRECNGLKASIQFAAVLMSCDFVMIMNQTMPMLDTKDYIY